MKESKTPDWERIEADYRAGVMSVREIAAAQGVSHVAIAKRAKKHEWVRDLSDLIRAKSDALVTTAVTKKTDVVTSRAIISANAEVIANIRLNHRKDIRRARDLCMTLMEELEVQTIDLELFQNLGEMLRSEDENASARRQAAYERALSSAGRIDGMKKLSETLKNLVALEREAYSIESATKLEVSGPNGQPLRAAELSDEELAAIVNGTR